MVGTNDAFLMLYRPTLPRRSRRRWRRGSRWGRWNAGRGARGGWRRGDRLPGGRRLRPSRERGLGALGVHALHGGQIGRASCRGRGEISVGGGSLKKKNRRT